MLLLFKDASLPKGDDAAQRASGTSQRETRRRVLDSPQRTGSPILRRRPYLGFTQLLERLRSG
ncbi:MAG: hypothetical protein V7K20_04450 [Nostoc sp.]